MDMTIHTGSGTASANDRQIIGDCRQENRHIAVDSRHNSGDRTAAPAEDKGKRPEACWARPVAVARIDTGHLAQLVGGNAVGSVGCSHALGIKLRLETVYCRTRGIVHVALAQIAASASGRARA
jgi:hypothetical protein